MVWIFSLSAKPQVSFINFNQLQNSLKISDQLTMQKKKSFFNILKSSPSLESEARVNRAYLG